MKRFLTTIDLSKIFSVDIRYLNNYISKCPLVYKKRVPRKIKTKRGTHIEERLRYVLDIDKLDDFKCWWENRYKTKLSQRIIEDGGIRYVWTKTARECFEAKFFCQNCRNYEDCTRIESYLGKKPIKERVLMLFSAIGAPPKERIEDDSI